VQGNTSKGQIMGVEFELFVSDNLRKETRQRKGVWEENRFGSSKPEKSEFIDPS